MYDSVEAARLKTSAAAALEREQQAEEKAAARKEAGQHAARHPRPNARKVSDEQAEEIARRYLGKPRPSFSQLAEILSNEYGRKVSADTARRAFNSGSKRLEESGVVALQTRCAKMRV